MEKWIRHSIFWIVYILFWAILTNDQNDVKIAIAINLCFSSFHLLTAYSFYSLIVPRYIADKKTVPFILSGLGSILLNALFLYLSLHLFFKGWATADFFYPEKILPSTFISLLITAIIFIFWKLLEQQRITEAQKLRAEKNALSLELELLKNQVNPHFLLNSLNNVYFLIKQNPVLAADALLRFSDILKLQLYEFNKERIKLSEEIKYLENYIELQKLRLNENVQVDFETQVEQNDWQIAPLLLIVLVENAFKHIPRDEINKTVLIEIKLSASNGKIVFHSRNTTKNVENSNLRKGIGLQNLRKRLEHLYPQSFELTTFTKEGKYFTKLILECEK